MEKIKEILKYILGILAAVFGILILKRQSDSNTIENATIKAEAKDEVLSNQLSTIEEKIEKTEEMLAKVKKDGPQSLDEKEVIEFYKKNL